MSEQRFQQAKPIVDFPAAERAVMRFWQENRIFEKSLERRRDAPKFIFNEGPPTANGLPHNGHVLTRVFKDVFLRYQTMAGKHVPRKAGWDTHGLPVEVEVEKELGIHGKEAIERYGVENFIRKCVDSVFAYTEEWERMTKRVGFWVDLSDAYVTFHKSYVESVWWALSRLFEKGLLYKGHKIVWWWPQGGTALSAGEVGLGYKTVEDPSVYVALPLDEDPSVSLLVWTTTPWTLPANQYAAVRPEYEYVQVKDGARSLILAAALRETIEQKLGRDLPVEKNLKGADLLGKRYRPPFPYFYDSLASASGKLKNGGLEPYLWKVLAADFVDLDTGTGLVHEAPAFGEVDYALHKTVAEQYVDPEAVPLLCPVAPDGKFTAEVPDAAGQGVKAANRLLIRLMKESGVLVHRENYRHEYPFCWRADDDPLIQYARPAWFIRTTARNKQALANNDAIHWLPEHIGTGRFGDFLRNNVDWALSRERYWGTPLNVWVNDITGRMQAPASSAEILKKNPAAFDCFQRAKEADPTLPDHLMVHKPWIDEVVWTEPGEAGVYRRVPEVIDCWFDSGCMPFAQYGFPHQGREEFESRFPADYITEAIDQTRGWFYSQLMVSTLVFDDETCRAIGLETQQYPHPFKICIVLGFVNDPYGKKESKSKGNYTPPDVIFDLVAQDFAVVSGRDCGQQVRAGRAVIAKEDLEALDLKPGETVKVYRSGAAAVAGIELSIQPGKRMPRRVAALADEDREALGAKLARDGAATAPNDVRRLPAGERITIEAAGAAPGADAFRWMFLSSNQPWSDKRHSLANVRAAQKEFPLKLRNVYSFFTIYANIDGFDPTTMAGRAPVERALLDRWILSELALLSKAVADNMETFHAHEAAVELNRFVDVLSNWYLRRSRARYWKSEFDDDKRDAYATLYECLAAVVKLAAPFTPFLSEEIYQNIVRGPGGNCAESVHLSGMPASDASCIDLALSEEMAIVRNIVSLGLRVRTAHRLKVRQPLRGVEVVLSDPALRGRIAPYANLIEQELNVHRAVFLDGDQAHVSYTAKPNFRQLGPRLGKKMKIAKQAFAALDAPALRSKLLADGFAEIDFDGEALKLEPSDIEVAVEAVEHFAAAGDSTAVVALNTELDDALRDEGLYRELLHHVQNFRKELNIDYVRRIHLSVTGSDRIVRVLRENREHFMKETLCTGLLDANSIPPHGELREFSIAGESARVVLVLV